MIDATPTEDVSAVRARVIELEAALAAERELRVEWERKHDRLLGAYQALEQQLELIRRRLYVAKAERIDTTQLELEFAEKLAALDALAGQLTPAASSEGPEPSPSPSPAGDGGKPRKRTPPTGRRNLRELDVPEERIEIIDPTLEGTVARLGPPEESSRMMWRRAGYVRVVTSRIKYLPAVPLAAEMVEPPATDDTPARPAVAAPATTADASASAAIVPVELSLPQVVTASLPPEMIERSFGTPSLWAHVVADKLCWGLPLYRQEERFAHAGFRIDRGTLCRWLEDLGLTVGATVVHAMREEALRTAFCIATDATGVLVQPIRSGDKQRRACQRGHYFVQLADADHVFFGAPAKPARLQRMKESNCKGVANHTGPESWVHVGNGADQALTGERTGWVLSREIRAPWHVARDLREADALEERGRQQSRRRFREAMRVPARSETPCTCGRTAHGNREIPRLSAASRADRIGKPKGSRR